MKIVAGVDCHKETHTVAFLDAVGSLLREITIPAAAGYQSAIDEGLALSSEVVWRLEGTGCYGHLFAAALANTGTTVYKVPGSFTKRHRKHASRRGKSDPNDARAIAEAVLREADRLPRFRDSDQQRALRLRYDQRDRFVRMRTEQTNKLHAAVLQIGLGAAPGDLDSKNMLSALRPAAEKQRDGSYDVATVLSRVVQERGASRFIRCDNGPEFVSKAVDQWAYWNKVELDFSRPGKPTDNAFCESFNGRVLQELLNASWFESVADAQARALHRRHEYNHERPHGSIANVPPAEFAKTAPNYAS